MRCTKNKEEERKKAEIEKEKISLFSNKDEVAVNKILEIGISEDNCSALFHRVVRLG